MKSKNELKEIDIKTRVCYYFDNTINGTKSNFGNSLLDKKLYENISVYDISYKPQRDPKPVRIRFDKTDGFIMVLNGKIKDLVLLAFHNIIILIKSVVNKNKNKYYYNRFLEKDLYKYKSYKQYF